MSLFSADASDAERDAAYDTSVVVSYATTTEYRSCLRKLFNMVNMRGEEPASESGDAAEDACEDAAEDAETRDENDYDESMCCKMMDFIYLHTKENPVLLDLYENAAATLMSVDCEIGLVVLFSYDYFHMFHLVLCDYFTAEGGSFGSENEHVIDLLKMFKK